MPTYLIINHPPAPIPARADVENCVTYFQRLAEEDPRVEVCPIVGLKGYATLATVESHEELLALLHDNPMGDIEDYRVLPLASLEGSA